MNKLSYEDLELELLKCPMTYIPALLAIIIERARKEHVFNGWMGFHSFVQRAYKKAGRGSDGR